MSLNITFLDAGADTSYETMAHPSVRGFAHASWSCFPHHRLLFTVPVSWLLDTVCSFAHPLLSYNDAGTSSQPLQHSYACIRTENIAYFTALLSENVPPG